MKKTVLGCLPYLNVKPLIRSIEHSVPPGYELIYRTPSLLARGLREGTCDIAAVSSFEALDNPDLVIVPDISISSDGKVSSVLLFSNREIGQIRTVALDTSSLSGAALTRILLNDLYGLRPELIRCDPEPSRMLEVADACLVIGNNAMTKAPPAPFTLDLGEGWKRLTGLPFVFAVWAARRAAVDERDVQILLDARRQGMAHIDEIAREEAPGLGIPVASARNYMAEIMVYDLGDRELQGLREFCRRAQALGLLGPQARPNLYQGQPAAR